MGSKKPENVIRDIIEKHDYNKPQVMFIAYQKEDAVISTIDRYLRGNFDNIETTGRGGRYVMSSVLESATKMVDNDVNVGRTLELFGREAITDNEIFLVELLESDIAPDDAEDVRIINRYSRDDPNPRSNYKSIRLQIDKVDGKFVVRRQVTSDLDGLAEYKGDK